MNGTMLLAVAAGGALGSMGRYAMMSGLGAWFGPATAFPYGTLAVNLLGSLVMGMLVEASALIWSPSPELRAFLAIGVLGGFTTFSTFSLDVVVLLKSGNHMAAFVYVATSFVLGVAALFAGMALMRQVIG